MDITERSRAEKSIRLLKENLEKCKKLAHNFGTQYALAEQYYRDAVHYFNKGDYFTSFGCSDYAYGLLDAIQLVKEHQYFPEPVVGAVILNNNSEVFLMRSHKWHNKYVIPGGHIELGESAEDALRREIKEETNLDIYNIRHIITQEFIHDPAFWKKRHFIMFDYLCRARNPSSVRLNSEGQEHVWMPLKKAALSKQVEPYTRKTLKAAAQQLSGKKMGRKRTASK
ncbi:MAG: DUF357 domain-containing protein [Candidatus Micrarchaeia archaeon]